jgi:2-polyprenyl-3-methyl-5-hydroxy-6-metoxy-1,4-benzoquinol methylase
MRMKRIPEPELMDSEAQTRAYAEADFSESNRLFVRKFEEYFTDCATEGSMADLGCGPGDISFRMARKLPGWEVLGLDAGENMLKLAQQQLAVEKFGGRVNFQLSYLPDSSLARSSFDAIISNSLLHHLPQPSVLWQSVAQLAKTGAAIQIMDLLRPETEQKAQRLVDEYSADAPEILREDFYNSLLAAYTPNEISQQLLTAGLDRLKIEIASDRHWIVHGRLENGR